MQQKVQTLHYFLQRLKICFTIAVIYLKQYLFMNTYYKQQLDLYSKKIANETHVDKHNSGKGFCFKRIFVDSLQKGV